MKRKTSERKNLRSFRITLSEFEILERDLRALFTEDVHSHVSVERRGEELTFDSVDELRKEEQVLPSAVEVFSFWANSWTSGDNRRVHLSTSHRAPSVSAEAPDLAWCAAAVAVCKEVSERGQRWYWWLRRWHFWLLAFSAGIAPSVLRMGFQIDSMSTVTGAASWGVLLVVLWAIYFAFWRIFPAATLVVRAEENWFKRYSPELTLALSLAAIVMALLDFFWR